ncbi:hypothetical protein [Caballeronia sordidicola]|uniref:Uncharacterized protein n=1 Tax=Caballeronia sordidicola TaxID=196367 RepID=A0A242M7U3_CABSO|nr:hypothetical protein [Caballeronia sordidicola]OTP67335.1 hypothetical protein PAMC26510_31700 [Caballeronia sordidicola]
MTKKLIRMFTIDAETFPLDVVPEEESRLAKPHPMIAATHDGLTARADANALARRMAKAPVDLNEIARQFWARRAGK